MNEKSQPINRSTASNDQLIAKRQGEISQAFSYLSAQNERLLELVKTLSERVIPILSDQSESGDCEATAVRGFSSDLASGINSKAEQVYIVNGILENIINRIEL